jgi:catechol 2,3-dioxygenase-like lactoylglutathione lyase family enzyme
VGRGLRGDPGNAAYLAPAAGHPQMGLHQPTASRATVHRSRDPQARDPQQGLHLIRSDHAPIVPPEDRLRATRIMANLRVAHVEAAKSFYTHYLGLSTEEFNVGWVARYTSPGTRANVQRVTRDAAAPEDSVISVHTDDVEGAHAEAQKLGYEIVHPITTEPWGVRRFFVRAPDGNVINIVNYRD